MPKKTSQKNKKILLSILLFLIILTLGLYLSPYPLSYFTPKKLYNRLIQTKQKRALPESSTSEETAKKPPCPSPLPLPEGPDTYRLSHSESVKGPRLQTVTLDPIKLKEGQTQTLTATIKYDSDVTKASITIKTDNKQKEKDLELTSGTAQNGTWQTSWTLDDTYKCDYVFDFLLESEKDNWDGAITIR